MSNAQSSKPTLKALGTGVIVRDIDPDQGPVNHGGILIIENDYQKGPTKRVIVKSIGDGVTVPVKVGDTVIVMRNCCHYKLTDKSDGAEYWRIKESDLMAIV